VGQNTAENKTKSINFVLEQINYINKSAQIIKSKLSNPTFYLWSNDFKNIDKSKFNFHYEEINLEENNDIIDRRTTSLFLMKHCNHFIVTGSTFNWWGAWLSDKESKIILRPSDNFFSDFYINNKDFWPLDWNIVNV